MRERSLATRAEARDLISLERSLGSLDIRTGEARAVRTDWFDAIADHVRHGRIVVYDDVVVGRPDPLLREVVHLARLGHRAIERRLDTYRYVDEWDDAVDDLVEPAVIDFVLATLPRADRGRAVDGAVCRRRGRTFVHLLLAFELRAQLRDVARRARIGQGVVLLPSPDHDAGAV
jgi:hypothetical protein